jgi:hypothetical protein
MQHIKTCWFLNVIGELELNWLILADLKINVPSEQLMLNLNELFDLADYFHCHNLISSDCGRVPSMPHEEFSQPYEAKIVWTHHDVVVLFRDKDRVSYQFYFGFSTPVRP